ncbi:MocR-like pyridoxine biosynthesis transcription factor PdxR [Herbaspirillum sp. B65]|uniref:MocR-like pyridoxine biosynthesis transcription factor PdxR n=1 Tax=Herbaspirillum sp. B65 TaxID=137708 RepID=UPI000346299F|nr:PLP-dependent aminotransferase family protein [Herbaspirillum sp. B65]
MTPRASFLSELLLQKRNWSNDDPSADSMQRDLYAFIKSAILGGTLTGGMQLPPSRTLSKELLVSRNTVVHAYDQLLAEGYISATTGRGTFVAPVPHYQGRDQDTAGRAEPPARGGLSHRGSLLMIGHGASDIQWGAFVSGVPDVSLFPHAIWQRLLARHWRNPTPHALTYSAGSGHPALRRALAEHLRVARSVRCDSEQIVITAGIHQAIDVITRLLGDVGDQAWIEDPGYWGTRNVLVSNGLSIVPVPVDSQGMAPDDAMLNAEPPPKFIFTTPSHQYPLGTVMSLQRRLTLIDYAHRHGCWIVEDDYDSEFRFEGRPLASLQGLDVHDCVIYTGTFSKTLFPGLRMGYMVLPPSLAKPAVTALSTLFREGQLLQQAVLTDFIVEGHYASHIRKMRQVYAHRHALLRAAISDYLGPDWPVASHEAGLHLVLGLPDDADDVAICKELEKKEISVRPLSRYFDPATHARKGLLMGYACVEDASIRAGVRVVAAAFKEMLN